MHRNKLSLCIISLLAIHQVAALQQQQQQIKAANQQQVAEEQHPAPEPYSFSYTAESNGGYSTHQERADGSGKIVGFYTIMGEDGRERRVDYVADENGYRASISTNEVGTRSENSADATYNAQLPSAKQLEAAKISAEGYKYLEDTHLAYKERTHKHVDSKHSTVLASVNGQSSFSSNAPQAPAFRPTEGPTPVYQPAPAAFERLPSPAPVYQPVPVQPAAPIQSEPVREEPLPIDPDAGWRSRAAKLINNQQQVNVNSNWRAPQAITTDSSGYSASVETNQQARQEAEQQVPWRGVTSNQQRIVANSGNNQPTAANRPKPVTVLQKQMEQQFMLQATQLTDQDYPRQVVQQSVTKQAQPVQQVAIQREDRQRQSTPLPIPSDNILPVQVSNTQQLVRQPEYPKIPQPIGNNVQLGSAVDQLQTEEVSQQQPQEQVNIVNDQIVDQNVAVGGQSDLQVGPVLQEQQVDVALKAPIQLPTNLVSLDLNSDREQPIAQAVTPALVQQQQEQQVDIGGQQQQQQIFQPQPRPQIPQQVDLIKEAPVVNQEPKFETKRPQIFVPQQTTKLVRLSTTTPAPQTVVPETEAPTTTTRYYAPETTSRPVRISTAAPTTTTATAPTTTSTTTTTTTAAPVTTRQQTTEGALVSEIDYATTSVSSTTRSPVFVQKNVVSQKAGTKTIGKQQIDVSGRRKANNIQSLRPSQGDYEPLRLGQQQQQQVSTGFAPAARITTTTPLTSTTTTTRTPAYQAVQPQTSVSVISSSGWTPATPLLTQTKQEQPQQIIRQQPQVKVSQLGTKGGKSLSQLGKAPFWSAQNNNKQASYGPSSAEINQLQSSGNARSASSSSSFGSSFGSRLAGR